MRNLTIKRNKSFPGCFGKVKVYIEEGVKIIAGLLAACTIAGCCYASPKVSQLKKTVEQIKAELLEKLANK